MSFFNNLLLFLCLFFVIFAKQVGFPLLTKKQLSTFCEKLLHFYLFSSEGKIALFTKKKITMDTPPFNTVVPIL